MPEHLFLTESLASMLPLTVIELVVVASVAPQIFHVVPGALFLPGEVYPSSNGHTVPSGNACYSLSPNRRKRHPARLALLQIDDGDQFTCLLREFSVQDSRGDSLLRFIFFFILHYFS
ncbi:hypothetical protein AV903_21275 [Erwinia tracheiphila]|uniref:Uncharacterized protein n=1 Tax=Erwinia tracheiphila TaxID=65700 RepID=A0A345CWZ6_9GAMM|nr:hypothetical protein AV903_21275 [Erwinia tracheiphila]